jgi:hypothetical protein
VTSAVRALNLNSKDLKDSKLTAIRSSVEEAFAGFAVAPGDGLEIVDEHVKRALDKLRCCRSSTRTCRMKLW